MGRSSGAGSPIWFMCPQMRKDRRMFPGVRPRLRDHFIRRTGRERPHKPPRGSALGARSDRVSREYACSCGHRGWSNHKDLRRAPLRPVGCQKKPTQASRGTMTSLLFKDRVPEAAADQLATVLVWLTECQLATLESLLMRSRVPKYELERQREICLKAVYHVWDLGAPPNGLRGQVCMRLKRLLDRGTELAPKAAMTAVGTALDEYERLFRKV